MKASIYISGQQSSNSTLKGYIQSANLHDTTESKQFGAIEIHFKTKTEARQAMKYAFRELKRDNPTSGQLYKTTDGKLFYDASKAEIFPLPTYKSGKMFS